MRIVFILFVLIICLDLLVSQTVIPGGDVSGNWFISGSPYFIEGEITIPNGELLSIDPGCIIEFQGHYKLIVQGRLLAVGTNEDMIHFTINDTTGFSSPYSYDGSWHSIRFEETSAVNDSSLIINCILEYGKAQGSSNNEDSHGGAIHIRNFSKVRISNCIIRNNNAYYGGGIYCREASPIITNNIIIDNYAESGGGLRSVQSEPIIQSNIFSDNNSDWSGGAIQWNGYGTNYKLFLINNLIVQNETEGSGGGISCGYSAQGGQMINNTICNNIAEDEGGGVSFYYMNCDIINCVIYDNIAYGIGSQVTLYDSETYPNFYYCNIEEGLEGFSGFGAIEFEGEYENNIDFEPNFMMSGEHPYSLSGNSYCINHGTPDIFGLNLPDVDLAGNSRIYEGEIQRIDIGAYEFQDDPMFVSFLHFSPEPDYYLLPQDIEIICETPNVTIYYTLDGSEPSQNSLLYTSPVHVSETTTVLAKAYRNNLIPSLTEGGVYNIGFNYFYDEISGTWHSEYSPYYVIGEAVIPDGETLIIEPGVEVIFTGHYRLEVQGRLLAEGTENNMITFTIDDNTGFNNIDIPDGGWLGIRFESTPATNDSSKIVYCNIKYGKAVGEDYDTKGGAIFIQDYSKVLISHCLIDSNKAYWNGAGIFCCNSGPIIRNNIIQRNQSITGSGICTCEESFPLITANTIIHNTTRPVGAGAGIVVCGDSAIITDNYIAHNSTPTGGYVSGAGGISIGHGCSYVYISNNTIEYNTGGFGGGINISGGNNIDHVVISNNIIRSNNGSYAGGVYCKESGMVLVNNQITNNFSTYGGGVSIFSDEGLTNPLIANNTIMNNNASNGGGIFISACCSPTIINTILWNNSGGQVYLRDYEDWISDPDFYFCDIQGGIEGFGFYVNTAFTGDYLNNIDADPRIMQSGSTPFSLDYDSPCINSACPDTSGLYLPEFDLAMNPRIYEGACSRLDIGAFEFQGETIYTAMPEFSLEPGIYEDIQVIELLCQNPEIEIYYTLDGSEPDQNSLFYTAPINISSNTIIKSRAYLAGLLPSVTLSGSFYIGTISGALSGMLTSSGSPYNVVGNLQIDYGDSLCIEPGVEFVFHGHYQFTVTFNATLIAQGTESENIIFRSTANCKWHHLVLNNSGNEDVIDYCIFTSGCASEDQYNDDVGGAICINNCSPTISNCIFHGNSAESKGGAIYMTISHPTLISNLIYANNAASGGGVFCSQSSPISINNTICYNHAEEDGGGIGIEYSSQPININEILWGNSAGCGNQVHLRTNNAQPNFYYCDIQGGVENFGLGANVIFEGRYENCIQENPQFIDFNLSNYHLNSVSPCIDNGTPSGWFVPSLLNTYINDLLGFNHYGSNYDIGCFEWQGVGFSNEEIETIEISINNYPNPFNPETTISFSIPNDSEINISVYNIKGQKVTTLINNEMEKGKHDVIWKSKDSSGKSVASGIYFYKLKVDGKTKAMRKCLLLK